MADEDPPEETVELMAMLKRRGFLKPAYDLYGGVAGLYDYGPLGQGLKRNFEDLWRQHYVVEEGFGEVSTPTVAPRAVFEASGHLDQFDDVLVECPECNSAARADHLLEDEFDRLAAQTREAVDARLAELPDERAKQLIEARDVVLDEINKNRAIVEHEATEEEIAELLCVDDEGSLAPIEREVGEFRIRFLSSSFRIDDARSDEVVAQNTVRCPSCDHPLHESAHVGPFNLMFSTRIGPGDGDPGFLRPETAQGLFVNTSWLYRYEREQVPFGAVQIGRAYRNEIAPRQGLIRLREFWQAEAEVFVDPDDKTHPDFEELADVQVDLVPDGREEVATTLREAVEDAVIANEMVAYFVGRTQQVLTEAGVDRDRLRFRQHESDEMAHYAADCWDAEFSSERYGWVECVGIADRGCYDLERHEEKSGERMRVFRRFEETIEREVTRVEPDMSQLGPAFTDRAGEVAQALGDLDAERIEEGEPVEVEVEVDGERLEVPAEAFEVVEETERVEGEWVYPHVIEPSYGVDRILYAVLEHNWDAGERDKLALPAPLAPIDVGVLPLVSKDGLPGKAREIEAGLKRAGLVTFFDEGGSIGRRYARLDEVGTPVCVTVDHETLEEGTVTVRDRDSAEQARVPVDDLASTVADWVDGRLGFEDLA